MVKRENNNVVNELEKLNENETLAVLDYISELLSARLPIPKPKEKPINDDLIISLSDAYENKRARQVFEWERVRRKDVQKAA